MKPWIHAESSAKRYGGIPEDYLEIHDLLDSSKGAIADSRHRALTHTSWFLFILEKIFGTTLTNSDGRTISVREIGERHILEDFRGRFIPTPQDYLGEMECKEWMIAGKGNPPPSFHKLRIGKMSNKEKYAEAKRKIEEAQKFCQETVRAIFDEGAAEVFAKHPRLKSFGWSQYTPYWCDGDVCEFSAMNDYPDIVLSGNDMEGDIEICEGHADARSLTYEEDKVICEDVKDFLGGFDDDDLLMMFEDHATVTVTRESVEVSECEHE
jgi:hypothetical protein